MVLNKLFRVPVTSKFGSLEEFSCEFSFKNVKQTHSNMGAFLHVYPRRSGVGRTTSNGPTCFLRAGFAKVTITNDSVLAQTNSINPYGWNKLMRQSRSCLRFNIFSHCD